jgi:hypothetical protein
MTMPINVAWIGGRQLGRQLSPREIRCYGKKLELAAKSVSARAKVGGQVAGTYFPGK